MDDGPQVHSGLGGLASGQIRGIRSGVGRPQVGVKPGIEAEVFLFPSGHRVDGHRVLPFEIASQQFFRERIFDELLNGPTERTSPVVQVRTLLDQEFLRLITEGQGDTLLGQPLTNLGEFDVA